MSVITHAKLNGVTPKDIIAMLDYDLTLANKDHPTQTDPAPLTAIQYEGLSHFSSRIGRNIILTARGELSVLNKYLAEHVSAFGRLPNTTLASNSGHMWHKIDLPRSPYFIEIPGHTQNSRMSLVSEIHNFVTDLKHEFPDITADAREACGAVVFEFMCDGQKTIIKNGQEEIVHTSSRFDQLASRATELKNSLTPDISKNIIFSDKNWTHFLEDGAIQMRGYIDIIPVGMNKGYTAAILFDHYKDQVENPFLIVAGDSGADYDMMKALAHELPEARRLFISVGKGLVEHDNAYAKKHGGQKLLDIVFEGNGLFPVDQMHAFLQNVGVEGCRPAFTGGKHATVPAYIPGGQTA